MGPLEEFGKYTGVRTVIGRFVPGTLTNPSYSGFMEPEVIFISDPRVDRQALKEAVEVGIPIVGLCDTEHLTSFIDLIIPANNKGKKAVALLYYLLTREFLKNKGIIEGDKVPFTYEEFLERAMNPKVRIIIQPQDRRRRRRRRKK